MLSGMEFRAHDQISLVHLDVVIPHLAAVPLATMTTTLAHRQPAVLAAHQTASATATTASTHCATTPAATRVRLSLAVVSNAHPQPNSVPTPTL